MGQMGQAALPRALQAGGGIAGLQQKM